MFEELLKVKKVREQSAANAVTKARNALREAQQAVVDAEQAVEDHEAFRVVEEARLFDEIRGVAVKLDEIDEMKFKVGLLRDKTEELCKSVEDKKKAAADAQTRLEEAEAAKLEAEKALRKFEEFVEIQREAERVAAVEAEEAEVEEVSEAVFAGRMKGADV